SFASRASTRPSGCEISALEFSSTPRFRNMPLSGARIAGTAALELRERNVGYALATMCIGVGQGIAVALERV
ncbi:hypothetical protein NKI37_19680, partial [Mesorhizobium sp. M0626]